VRNINNKFQLILMVSTTDYACTHASASHACPAD
jgi:hypothetical protein